MLASCHAATLPFAANLSAKLLLLGCTAVTVKAALATAGAAPDLSALAASLLTSAAGFAASVLSVLAPASALSVLPEQATPPSAMATDATTASNFGCDI